MTEIKIERRDRSPLPWLLALVLLIALAWFLFSRNANEGIAGGMRGDSTYRDTSAAAGTLAPPAASVDSSRRASDTSAIVPPR